MGREGYITCIREGGEEWERNSNRKMERRRKGGNRETKGVGAGRETHTE